MGIYSYITSLWETISTFFWGNSSSTPDQTKPSESSDKLHQFPSQYYPKSLTDTNEIADVEKIYLNVKCAGKIMEVGIFPQEKISVLLKEVCDRAGKKPEIMTLVYEGEHLDVNEKVYHYSLRGGTIVNLIHI